MENYSVCMRSWSCINNKMVSKIWVKLEHEYRFPNLPLVINFYWSKYCQTFVIIFRALIIDQWQFFYKKQKGLFYLFFFKFFNWYKKCFEVIYKFFFNHTMTSFFKVKVTKTAIVSSNYRYLLRVYKHLINKPLYQL